MMKRKSLILLIAVVSSVLAQKEDPEVEDDVIVLRQDNFQDFVQTKGLVMVEFYAPWCGHCKKLEPEYKKAAQELIKSEVYLTKIDATKESALAQEFEVQGYPTIIIFKNGEKVEDYSGDRTAKEIISHMTKLADPNWRPPPSAIVALTSDNFTKFIKTEKLALAMWYAPWCKHCKKMMPEFEGAAQELKEWGIPLAKIDGINEKELADQFNIEGWPTFKLFRKGRVFDYKGQREKQGIISYMKEQAMPPSEEKIHKLAIKNNLDRTEATVVGYFSGKTDFYEEFIAAANEMRGSFKFMHTFDPEIAKSFDVPQESIVVFMPEITWSEHEEKIHVLRDESASYKEIMTFIQTNSVPLVGWRTKRNAFKYTDRPLMVAYYDVNFEHAFTPDTQYIRKKILQVAKDFKGSNLRFAISNEDEYADELKQLGFEDSGADVNVACFSRQQKYRMKITEEFESENLAEFIQELRVGKVAPYLKSSPVPKTQEGSVLTVVANNYDSEIHKVRKDAVIFFHAPWCGHCKQFDPEFKKIASKVTEDNPNILFAKMDATANDIPAVFPSLQGYPSVFLVKAYEKFDPIQYQGDRSYDAVIAWISKHSTNFSSDEKREEKEIESYQADNFEADFAVHKKEEHKEGKPKAVKEEL